MLQKIYIKNFAIIEELDMHFNAQFTAITGETGAGKSILLGALALIMGERADSNTLLHKQEKCIVEATFNIEENKQVKNLLQILDIDFDQELILRREINPQQKSRSFINDTPTTLTNLAQLTSLLLDMHRQFDTLDMQSKQVQLQMFDSIAQAQPLLNKYSTLYIHWRQLDKAYQQLKEENINIKKELDYVQFQFSELDSLNILENEFETIEKDLALLLHGEQIKTSLQKALHLLHDDEHAVENNLKTIIHSLQTYSSKVERVADITNRLQAAFIEIKDIDSEISHLFDNIHYNPEQIEELTLRLNEGNRLMKKHNVVNTHELIILKNNFEQKLLQANHSSIKEEQLKQTLDDAFQLLEQQANALSAFRKKNTPAIEKNINALLKKVGMPNATVKIDWTTTEFHALGTDECNILFDANQIGKFAPISKIASGGELSRLMLSIKSLMAKSTHLPTLIFDEIDTGISGETAKQVGIMMKELGILHQVVAVTHLPQIAAMAQTHLYVYKKMNEQKQLHTTVKQLSDDERINELATMLSGNKPSQQALDTAKELILN